MDTLIKPLQDLIEKFRSLDGVGKKSAMKMAFSVLDMESGEAFDFAQSIIDAKTKVGICKCCQNISSDEILKIARNIFRIE